MKANKKDFGNGVNAILNTIIEIYCCVGEDDIEDIVNMFNTAHVMAAIWDLKEINLVEEKANNFNGILACDDSIYRIIKEDHTYKLAILK